MRDLGAERRRLSGRSIPGAKAAGYLDAPIQTCAHDDRDLSTSRDSSRHVHYQPREGGRSGGESAGVTVMKPADLGEGYHVAHLGRLDWTRIRAVVVQRPVGSRCVVVGRVASKDPQEVPFIENDNVVEALSADRSDQALTIWILPRRAGAVWQWSTLERSRLAVLHSQSAPVLHGQSVSVFQGKVLRPGGAPHHVFTHRKRTHPCGRVGPPGGSPSGAMRGPRGVTYV